MSVCDDIKKLVERLRSYMRSSKYIIAEDIYAAVDTIEALLEERDRLKDEVEHLRNKTAGTHGTPELDDDARKLEAMGQDPGATFTTDPAPAVCVWTGISEVDGIVHYATRHGVVNDLNMWWRDKTCGFCGLPIFFKLEAMGQDPGATFTTDPAPAVCEWTRAPYTALYTPRCDADYLCNVPGSGICRRCGLPIKFTETEG